MEVALRGAGKCVIRKKHSHVSFSLSKIAVEGDGHRVCLLDVVHTKFFTDEVFAEEIDPHTRRRVIRLPLDERVRRRMIIDQLDQRETQQSSFPIDPNNHNYSHMIGRISIKMRVRVSSCFFTLHPLKIVSSRVI